MPFPRSLRPQLVAVLLLSTLALGGCAVVTVADAAVGIAGLAVSATVGTARLVGSGVKAVVTSGKDDGSQ